MGLGKPEIYQKEDVMTNGWLRGRGEGGVNQEGGVGHPDRHLDERCLADWISKDGVPRRLHAGELVSSHGAIHQTPHPALA